MLGSTVDGGTQFIKLGHVAMRKVQLAWVLHLKLLAHFVLNVCRHHLSAF
jgi:hypothetical protein